MLGQYRASFDEVWSYLAAQGFTADQGGAEYRRLAREWDEAGRPRPLTGWLVERLPSPPGSSAAGSEG
jgi:hypothetical protein